MESEVEMKTNLLWVICIVAIVVGLISVVIGVRGQEAVIWKNVSIQEFALKNKVRCVVFIENEKGEKFEAEVSPEQKIELIKAVINKVADLGIKFERDK